MKPILLNHISCLLNPQFLSTKFMVFLSFYVLLVKTIWENGWTQEEKRPHTYETTISKTSFILKTKIWRFACCIIFTWFYLTLTEYNGIDTVVSHLQKAKQAFYFPVFPPSLSEFPALQNCLQNWLQHNHKRIRYYLGENDFRVNIKLTDFKFPKRFV